MRIFYREIKANFRSLLIWSAITILITFMGMTKFSAFASDPELLDVLDSMPPALLDAFQINAFNLTTISGFFGVMFSYLALIVAIYAVILGSDIISKEERDKTVEFSLVLPVSRVKVVTAKLVASVVLCLLFILIIAGSSIAMAQSYETEEALMDFLVLYFAGLFMIEMIFLAVGTMLGCAMKQYKRASSISVSILLATYIFSVMTELDGSVSFLKYFSPFKYVSPLMILNESRIEPVYIVLSFGIIVVSLMAGYLIYQRRDLYI